MSAQDHSKNSVVETDVATSARQEMKSIIARIIDAWNSHDAEKVAECYAPDAVYTDLAPVFDKQDRLT